MFFRLDKRDERRGPAPRAAERGCSLQRLPAPKAAGEARHDLLLANPSQSRLHYLRRVGRFGPVVSYVIVEEEVAPTIAPLCASAIFGYNVVAGDLVLRRVGGP